MAGPPVLVARRLPAPAMERLAAECDVTLWPEETAMPRDVLLAQAAGKLALLTLLTERVDDELLDAAGRQLLVVANYAVGVDNIDVGACTRRAVMVTNTPDVLTEATADMAWALMMAAARRVAEGDRLVRSGRPWIWAPEMLLGRDLGGATLGIVGYGRIGRAVARRAHGFRMRVLVHDGSQTAKAELDGVASVSLDDLLTSSDFVSLHVDLNPSTWHLISAEQLARMKPTAVLVNTSRGPVVDEVALAEALDTRAIFGAGLDVYEREPTVEPRLLANERVVLAPHLGSATVGTRTAMGLLAAENVIASLHGDRPPSLLNPEALTGRAPAVR